MTSNGQEMKLYEASRILQKELAFKGAWYKALAASIMSALSDYRKEYGLPFEDEEGIDRKLSDISLKVADRIIGLDNE